MTPFLALLLQAVPAAASPPRDVVVIAQPLAATARALAQCRERACPPDEEARAALAHAENQFVAGAYEEARRTLRGTIRREGRYAAAYPVAIGDLWRATGRIDLHLGESRLYRLSQIESLAALKAGLPATDGRVLVQRLEIADADARIGDTDEAMRTYEQIARDAGAAGQITAEAHARLRLVTLLAARVRLDAGFTGELRQAVAWLDGKPDLAVFAATARGRAFAPDAAPAPTAPGAAPQLLYAPPIEQQYSWKEIGFGVGPDDIVRAWYSSSAGQFGPDTYEGEWADISFHVMPDGSVADVDVVRAGPALHREWLKPVTASIAGRRYAAPAGEAGTRRIERYTLTASWTNDVTGTRLRRRALTPHIVRFDLTPKTAVATPPAPAAGEKG